MNRFVIKCEMNLTVNPNLDQIDQPAWWPPDLPFTEATLLQRQHRGVSVVFRGGHLTSPLQRPHYSSDNTEE
jgi:hypothetical protein